MGFLQYGASGVQGWRPDEAAGNGGPLPEKDEKDRKEHLQLGKRGLDGLPANLLHGPSGQPVVSPIRPADRLAPGPLCDLKGEMQQASQSTPLAEETFFLLVEGDECRGYCDKSDESGG